MADAVQQQYEAYPYPARDPRDEAKRLIVGSPSDLREINHYLYRGALDLTRPLRALVAGGGTGDAAIMLAQQLANATLDARVRVKPGERFHEVVYLDLSVAARKVAEARAEARGLGNIRFVTGSLLDLPRLAPGPYDYIDCCGVLHHLPDPAAGLAALVAQLKPGAGLGLMLYGEYGRRGVYELQALLRDLAPGETLAARVGLARRLLGQLPASNWFRRNPFLTDHKLSDAELVDLLLHSQDRAYRVAEILELVQGAGLTPVSFLEPLRYAPESYSSDTELRRRFATLAPAARWAAAEALAGSMKTHVLYATLAEGPTLAESGPDMIPQMTKNSGPELARALAASLTLRVEVGGITLQQPLPRLAPALLQRIDGRRTLAQIFAEVAAGNAALEPAALRADWDQLYAALAGFNLLLLRRAQA